MTEQQLLIKLLEQISTRIDNNDTDSAVDLSVIYQRIKSVQTTSVNDLQQFFKATQGAV